MNIKVD
jgi:hypothetical protein